VKRAQQATFGATLLYELGNKIPLPGNSGKQIYIPRDYPKNNVRHLKESAIISLCPTSGHFYSGFVSGWGDAIGYSDFLVSINEIPTLISNDVATMGRYLGYKYDNLCRAKLSAAGTWVSPDGGGTAQGAVSSDTNLLQRFLFDANSNLASTDAPLYPDGNYAGVFHPRQTHDLFVSLSGGSQLRKTQSNAAAPPGFLENTELGAQKLERATLGTLANVRVMESTQSVKFMWNADRGVASVVGMSSDTSGYGAYVMGPGAFAAVDLANQRPRVWIKPFGSAGTADPVNQVMSVGIKGYFAAVGMDTANRLIRTASGKTI
jgi:N4-gp56 family major capsid protein